MKNFNQVAAGLLLASSSMAAPKPATPPEQNSDTVKPGLTAAVVKSANQKNLKGAVLTTPMATNQKVMPRLFPSVPLPKFELVSPPAGGVTADPAVRDLDTFLELSMASGYSPGAYLTFMEIETARTMNPLARASKSKRNDAGKIIGLEENGSACGAFMFINSTWDRVLNTHGEKMLEVAGVRPGRDLSGKTIFKDDNFTDQQIVDIVRQNTGRDTVIGDIPKVRGSDELMALRSNTKLSGAAKTMLNDETLEMARNLGITPTLGTLYQGHVFGSLSLSASAGRGQGAVSASSIFSNAVVDANRHLFTGSVNDTLSIISSMTDARAAGLEKKYYGTVFTPDAKELKRLETPQAVTDATGHTVNVAPMLSMPHNSLPEFVKQRQNMHAEVTGYDTALKGAKTPQELAAAEAKRNLAAAPKVEDFLKRTGYIGTDAKTGKPNITLDGALANFRSDVGLPPGRTGFFDNTTLGHIERADARLTKFAALQAQQATPAQHEVKASRKNPGQPKIDPTPGALDLRHMQKEQGGLFSTPKERKAEIAQQVVDLKKEMVASGLLTQPTQKVKIEEVDAKGRKQKRYVDQKREFDVKRDGTIDKSLLGAVSKAQEDRGLKGTGVVDNVTRAQFKTAPLIKPSHSIGIPVSRATTHHPRQSQYLPEAPHVASTGFQVQQMAALGRNLHPGENTPLKSFMQDGLAQVAYSSIPAVSMPSSLMGGQGPSSSFHALAPSHSAGSAFSVANSYARNEPTFEQVDLSRLTALAEPAANTAPVVAPRLSNGSKHTLS